MHAWNEMFTFLDIQTRVYIDGRVKKAKERGDWRVQKNAKLGTKTRYGGY